jgi:hypothetical protein|tara:strand:+ start:172 stop:687 length:516 start_codon:yes stop_codon:yes gene_type:complete
MKEHLLQYWQIISTYREKYGIVITRKHKCDFLTIMKKNIKKVEMNPKFDITSPELMRFKYMLDETNNFELEFEADRFKCLTIREEIMAWFNLGVFIEGHKYGSLKCSNFNSIDDKICHFNRILHLHKPDIKFNKLKVYNMRTNRHLEKNLPNRHLVEFLLYLQIQVLNLER